MKERTQTTKLLTIAISALAVLAVTSVCYADEPQPPQQKEWSRKGKGEFFIMAHPVSISITDYADAGIKDEFEDTTFYGFGVGGNFNDNFTGYLEILWCSPDSTASNGANSTNTFFGMGINVDYNLLKGRITPLVSGGIGFMSLSGEVEGVEYDSESHLSYNLGAGARWDITDNIAFKALYRTTWIELDDAADSTQFEGINFNLIFLFK